MSNHTPGPWRIRENARHSQDECDLTICGDIWQLADINGPQYEHQEANARLIAAAPELLEALHLAKRHMEHMAAWIADQKAGYSFESLGEDMPSINSAIAKATGATE